MLELIEQKFYCTECGRTFVIEAGEDNIHYCSKRVKECEQK
jgi:transposase-like protein